MATPTERKWMEVKAALVGSFGKLPPSLEEAIRVSFYGGVSFGALEITRLAELGDERGVKRLAAELEQGLEWSLERRPQKK